MGVPSLVGDSPAFKQILEDLPRLAEADATLLITGDTGTGKEVVARTLHYCSLRKAKPFVPINCAALPEALVENELFGHSKGAYTGATSAQVGMVEAAAGGTLFLDEIDTISVVVQAKLLRFLQDLEYRPLGSSRNRFADVRIVAASNVDLAAHVREGRFRSDLFYRLDILRLRLPPLRERIDDIVPLAKHFLEIYSRQYERGPFELSDGARRKLLAHAWAGNVRELQTTILRAVLLTSDSLIRAADVDQPAVPDEEDASPLSGTFGEAKARVIGRFEHDYLTQLLAAYEGNVSAAARTAGKDRRSFQRLMHKHGIDRHRFAGAPRHSRIAQRYS